MNPGEGREHHEKGFDCELWESVWLEDSEIKTAGQKCEKEDKELTLLLSSPPPTSKFSSELSFHTLQNAEADASVA